MATASAKPSVTAPADTALKVNLVPQEGGDDPAHRTHHGEGPHRPLNYLKHYLKED